MARTALGAVRYANTRRLPPQHAQVKTSHANVLLGNSAWSARGFLSFFGSLLTPAWDASLAPSSPAWGSMGTLVRVRSCGTCTMDSALVTCAP
ncbi:hypothetical protein [Cystobacter fuscus]|uniref:hypothetical protein n=1 Tax=Cystobacter fuscus TaxID=43 RepID=UPI0037BE2BC6